MGVTEKHKDLARIALRQFVERGAQVTADDLARAFAAYDEYGPALSEALTALAQSLPPAPSPPPPCGQLCEWEQIAPAVPSPGSTSWWCRKCANVAHLGVSNVDPEGNLMEQPS